MKDAVSQYSCFSDNAYINGKWLNLSDTKRFSVFNPANNMLIASVTDCDNTHLEAALIAAEQAQRTWRVLHMNQRITYLEKWHHLILQHVDELAHLLTYEQGKPITEAKQEILSGAALLKWVIQAATILKGEILPASEDGRQFLVAHEPIGLVVAITPWNYPFNLLLRKCVPALVVGCSIVAKPSEETPLIALALAKLAEYAEFPPGVFNVITVKNPQAFGNYITQHPLVRCISFTGSGEIGKLLLQQSAAGLKRVYLELGGNAPFIIMPDADLDLTVQQLVRVKLRNAGQTCVSPNRIFLHEDIFEIFVDKLIANLNTAKIGFGWIKETTVGPLINEQASQKIQAHIADAAEKGAQILYGGNRHPLGQNFFIPTILGNVTPEMLVTQQETFGPVFPLICYQQVSDAIDMANKTPYGLAAYVFDQDTRYLQQIAAQLNFGLIGFNAVSFTHEPVPFGGFKESGLGREGGKEGLHAFLETKTICFQEKKLF